MTVDEALAQVLAAIPGPTGGEWVHLADALGRVIAVSGVSTTDLPPWDNSAMDGYAIRAADVAAARADLPARLAVRGDIAAGADPADVEVRRVPPPASRRGHAYPVAPMPSSRSSSRCRPTPRAGRSAPGVAT